MTFRITWDGVPQVDGDFADVFDALAFAQRHYEDNAGDPMDDPDYITPDMTWSLGWDDRGARRRIRLCVNGKRSGVHIDEVA